MQCSDHSAPFALPLQHQSQQGGGGFTVYRVEGFVEQNQRGILHNQPRKQGALQLPAGQRAHRATLKPLQSHGLQCGIHTRQHAICQSAKRAGLAPKTQ